MLIKFIVIYLFFFIYINRFMFIWVFNVIKFLSFNRKFIIYFFELYINNDFV